MACTICEHCQEPVPQHENIIFQRGYSYHESCHKCYVCDEANLHDGEVFKGVIFCSSCSQRIFQGCSTARRIKESSRKPQGSRRRRSHRPPHKITTKKHQNGILELASLAGANSSESSRSISDDNKESMLSNSITVPTEVALTATKPLAEMPLKRSSPVEGLEIGMITEVTQELLKQMQCPVNDPKKMTLNVKPPKKIPKKKKPCSDLRIAELGMSTEIANMALRHRSELPVIIKYESTNHTSRSGLQNKESDLYDDYIDSAYSTLPRSIIRDWMDRRLGSILTLPFKSFKKNILHRSSRINNSISNTENKAPLLQKVKILFHHEINEHQKRGLKRLYSSINRQQPRNKLGWLNCDDTYHKRCKHLKESHSYRCMRAQAMRLAGPTKSELAEFRAKLKSIVTPRALQSPRYRYGAITMSQACGNSGPGSTKVV